MAFSKLSGDEQGIILGQLRNALEPRLVMYFSSANKELRALLPPAARQQLQADYEEATALLKYMTRRGSSALRSWPRMMPCSSPLSVANAITAARARSAAAVMTLPY